MFSLLQPVAVTKAQAVSKEVFTIICKQLHKDNNAVYNAVYTMQYTMQYSSERLTADRRHALEGKCWASEGKCWARFDVSQGFITTALGSITCKNVWTIITNMHVSVRYDFYEALGIINSLVYCYLLERNKEKF